MVEIKYVKSIHMHTFKLKGHAEYNPGNDIVCSAISNLAYTLLGALENINHGIVNQITLGSGYVEAITTIDSDEIKPKIDTIYETVLIGLLQLEAKYSENIIISVVDYSG